MNWPIQRVGLKFSLREKLPPFRTPTNALILSCDVVNLSGAPPLRTAFAIWPHHPSLHTEGSQVRSLHRPPSSPDKQRWFPDLRKSTPFQWLGGTKRSLRSRFLSFAPAERLKRPSVSSDKNSVSQIDGCLFRTAAGSVKRHSDIAILVRGGRDSWTVNQI
jgi:hypothetical protein